MLLNLNGKFFRPPPSEMLDFKELFRHTTLDGVGRQLDKDGVPIGPWTPELLAAEISEVSAGASSVDLRTVQRWFSDSDQGIKTENIRWLAKIFGCGDAEATRQWQIALRNAQIRLAVKRRDSRSSPKQARVQTELPADQVAAEQTSLLHKYPKFVENIFAQYNPLILPVILWAGFTTLAFMTYIFGVETITYSPSDGIGGLEKQVGFLWAPSWTILPAIILPAFIAVIAEILNYWRSDAINSFRLNLDRQAKMESNLLSSFAGLIWIVLFVSFVIVFALQWGGVHLRALLSGSASGYMIDWNNVALVRPDVIGIDSAIFLSFVAYLYYGFVIWVLFAGLILLLALATDFQVKARGLSADAEIAPVLRRVANATFRGALLALLFVICIKLQSTYLITGAESMSKWLWTDATTLVRGEASGQYFLHQRSIPQLTTVIILAIILLVLFTAYRRVSSVAKPSNSDGDRTDPNRRVWLAFVIVAMLSANVFVIGAVHGFAIFLGCSCLFALYSLYRPPFNE